jgi:esterase
MMLAGLEQGSGVPLVILHGLLGSSRNWATMAARFAGSYHVFAVDLRNHGLSPHDPVHTYPAMAEDVRNFLEQQGIARCHLLGHSMGGKVAMECALGFGERVVSLTVVDIAPVRYLPTETSALSILSSVDLRQCATRGMVDAALARSIPDERVRQFLLTNLRRQDDGGLTWRVNLEALLAHEDDLDDFPQHREIYPGPTLVLRGGKSAYVQDAHQAAIRSLFPAAEIETLASAGHWVHADDPDGFYEAVITFLRSVSESKARG